jgi:hypothetical protein
MPLYNLRAILKEDSKFFLTGKRFVSENLMFTVYKNN